MTISIIQTQPNVFNIDVRGAQACARLIAAAPDAIKRLEEELADMVNLRNREIELNNEAFQKSRLEWAEYEQKRQNVINLNREATAAYAALPWYKRWFTERPAVRSIPYYCPSPDRYQWRHDVPDYTAFVQHKIEILKRAQAAALAANASGIEFYFHHTVPALDQSTILKIVVGDQIVY